MGTIGGGLSLQGVHDSYDYYSVTYILEKCTHKISRFMIEEKITCQHGAEVET